MALSHTFCSVLGLLFFTVVCQSFRNPYYKYGTDAGDKDISQETVWRDSNSINGDNESNFSRTRRGRCTTYIECRRDQWCSCHGNCHETYGRAHCKSTGRSHLFDDDNEQKRIRRKFTCKRQDLTRDGRCRNHDDCGCGRRCNCNGFCHSACPNGR